MLKLSSQKPTKIKSELIALPVCENHLLFTDPTVVQIIQEAEKLKEFSGKKDKELLFYHFENLQTQRILLIGLGKYEDINPETLRQFAGKAVKTALKKKLSCADIVVPENQHKNLSTADTIESLLEGAGLANHVYLAYKKDQSKKPLKTIRLLTSASVAKKHHKIVDRVASACRANHLAREWINMPSNDKPPLKFADMISELARKADLKITLLKEKELIDKKFGALLAVAAGSIHRPCVLILEYSPPAAEKCIALVGKGVTFDAGGISLKPAAGMGDMKSDMSGAATVAATLLAAAETAPKTRLIGVLPLVENLPSGSACRPGDIVRSYGGKTIEIANTDAEGRLILADAMEYAVDTFAPDIMIDLATLTGACVVALGEKIAAVFSPDDALRDAIVEAGRHTHERCWPMPLPEDYRKLIKSDIADMRNVGKNRWAGAITAAIFLKSFVGETRWAHIDIAGPAYGKSDSDYISSGASGFGVRLLLNLLERI